MENNTPKTANQLYRESGSELSFSEWLEQEKAKGTFIKNDILDNVVQNALSMTEQNPQQITNKDKILGLSKPVLVISCIFIVGAITYKMIQKKQLNLS